MFARIRAALAAIIEYVEAAPGAVTLLGGEAVLLLARLGFNVSLSQLSAIMAIIIPLIVGVHVAARRSDFIAVEVAPDAERETPAEAPAEK